MAFLVATFDSGVSSMKAGPRADGNPIAVKRARSKRWQLLNPVAAESRMSHAGGAL
jgi:hypothetical protein